MWRFRERVALRASALYLRDPPKQKFLSKLVFDLDLPEEGNRGYFVLLDGWKILEVYVADQDLASTFQPHGATGQINTVVSALPVAMRLPSRE